MNQGETVVCWHLHISRCVRVGCAGQLMAELNVIRTQIYVKHRRPVSIRYHLQLKDP